MNAAITLSSNWVGYLFDEAILRLGQNCVENVRQLSIVTDVFYHMSDSEYIQKMVKWFVLYQIIVMRSLIQLDQGSEI